MGYYCKFREDWRVQFEKYKRHPLFGMTRAILRGKWGHSRFLDVALLSSHIDFSYQREGVRHSCGPVFTGISLCTKTYAELTTILKKQFALKKLVISERYRIHTSVQAENLNVSKFAAQLQRLPTTCNFGTHLMEALWDRLVCGLRIHKRLLTEDVNFEKAVQIAQGLEAAENDVAHLMVSVLTACSSYITPQAIVTTGHTSLLKREISSIHKTRVNPLQAINGNLSV